MKKIWERLLRKGENPRDPAVRKRLGTIGSLTGVGVNVLLTGMKLLIGTATGSLAVTADAINNLSDAGGSVMSLVSMRMAAKPVDKEHPFGHGRVEYLGALGVGVLILVMGVELLKDSVNSILHPAPLTFGWVPFLVLLLSILFKVGLYFFYHGVGQLIDASSLLAAAKDSLSDVLATSAVAASMLISHFTALPVDGWMGLIVALLVLKAGLGVVKDMADTLMGARTNPELGKAIIDKLLTYSPILGAHDLMIHDYGPGRCVASVHAEVPADGNLLALHEVIDRAEQDIGRELGIPICIHMDPIVSGDERTDALHAHLAAFLRGQGEGLLMHDLRLVPGESQINVVFDVLIPPGYQETEALSQALERSAQELDPRYKCVIHFDIDYYRELHA